MYLNFLCIICVYCTKYSKVSKYFFINTLICILLEGNRRKMSTSKILEAELDALRAKYLQGFSVYPLLNFKIF